jgi:hypothetical protein
LELKRKPAKLVMLIIAIAFFAGFMVMAFMTPHEERAEPSDIMMLKAIIFAYFTFIYGTTVKTGLATGGNFFNVEDVNFIFASPVDSRTVLLYGVVRTLKTVAFGSLFIPLQAMWLNRSYHIGGSGIAVIVTGYILFSLVIQISAMYIYNISRGSKRRKLRIKAVCAGIFLPMAAVFFAGMIASGMDAGEGFRAMMSSPVTSCTPVVGWAAAGITAFLSGDIMIGCLLFGLLALSAGLLILLIYKSNPDYYEDVLVASETMFEQKRKVAEGNASLDAYSTKKVRVKGTGVGGFGASAFFHKHMRESFRANRFGLWGAATLLFFVASAGYAALAVTSAGEEGFPAILMQLMILMFIQTGMVNLGRGMMETYCHYIYMIPENPFAKVVWSNIEVIVKTAVESVLFFGVSGIILRERPSLILAAMAAYTGFSFTLLAVNLFWMRFTGLKMNAGLTLFLYMFAIVIIMAPGIVGAGAAVLLLGQWGIIAGLGILTLWELLMAGLFFFASRGILHNCDMLVVKTAG